MLDKNCHARCLSALVVCGLAVAVRADEGPAGALGKAVAEGSVTLDFRYRYEYVDQDGFDEESNASTLRSRVTLASGAVGGFSALLELDNVSYIGNDNFNSTENGNTAYPVVADPKGTEVNQAWLRYLRGAASGSYGRQRILHGNERFVGGVGWRQNEQTYDGFRAKWGGGSGFSLDYAYVYRVHRVFGPDDTVPQPASWHGDNHLARLDWKISEQHSLAGFYYNLQIDERDQWSPNLSVNNSNETYGLEYDGEFGLLGVRASWATQAEAGDSDLEYETVYWLLEGAMEIAGVKGTAGYEVLAGDNGVGFKTPLATLHKFQGWADTFLVTPGDGLEDLYLGLAGSAGVFVLGAWYHDFQSEDSSEDFGTEWDLVANWTLTKNFSTQLKYANFESDSERYADTEKLWLTLQLKL